MLPLRTYLICLPVLLLLSLLACKSKLPDKRQTKIVTDPASMNDVVRESLKLLVNTESETSRDSMDIHFPKAVKTYYEKNNFSPIWSNTERFTPLADSMITYLEHAYRDGLFPETYRAGILKSLKKRTTEDSIKSDALFWAKADLLFTDELFHLLQDLGQGRLQPESMSWKNKETSFPTVFFAPLDSLRAGGLLTVVLQLAQPTHTNYKLLKSSARKFIDSMDSRSYTYMAYPFKDSLAFTKKLVIRLGESGIEMNSKSLPDSVNLAGSIKKYQHMKGLKIDGKITAFLAKTLNNTDREKFKRIAITLDRYKQLPRKMPEKYIWVNLPAYNLKLISSDSIVFQSKIICGKPGTPTPQLTSAITDMVIYPTWTIPSSIIVKDKMLVRLQQNAGYLEQKGFYLLNNKGEKVDPYAVNWAKYSKTIPFNVQQGSGDDNALGVIKFNFNNPYAVYLHDTNQRYLFNNSLRSLSHGCVRVQDWKKLAAYLVQNDSIMAKATDTLRVNVDSIMNWVAAKKKHVVAVKNKFPLFIRYFGCEVINGSIKFYDDIYSDDKLLREKYFDGN